MDFFNEFSSLLTGGHTAAFNLAAFMFVLFGATINVMYDALTRNVSSDDTPEKWEWKYFWTHNLGRFALNLLMALAVVRFFDDWTGKQPTMQHCFLIGLVFDAMIVVYKKLRSLAKTLIDKYIGNHNT